MTPSENTVIYAKEEIAHLEHLASLYPAEQKALTRLINQWYSVIQRIDADRHAERSPRRTEIPPF